MTDATEAVGAGEEQSRRDVLELGTGGVALVVAGAAGVALVGQMNPSADVLALSTLEVDIADLAEGSQITVKWRGKPVFVRYRTAEEIAAARATPVSALKDRMARNANAPSEASAADENRAVDAEGRYLVQMGVCTHLGCVPIGESGEYHGWFCPCHGSVYDTAGRIRKGPAPENLPIPKLSLEGTVLKLIEAYKG